MATVVLVPGVMGMTNLPGAGTLMGYWSGWTQPLRDAGYDVLTAYQPLGGGLARGARWLATQLDRRDLNRPFHLVGHSRGGLVVRMLASRSDVVSVTSVGTPHRGQFLIDLVYDPTDSRVRDLLLTGPDAITRPQLQVIQALVGDDPWPSSELTETWRPDDELHRETNVRALAAFNKKHGAEEDVLYCDVPAALDRRLPSAVLAVAATLIAAADPDALVPPAVAARRADWQQVLADTYGSGIDVFTPTWTGARRHHDGAVCHAAGIHPGTWVPAGKGGGGRWVPVPGRVQLDCGLDHCKQAGIMPSDGLGKLIGQLVARVFQPASIDVGQALRP